MLTKEEIILARIRVNKVWLFEDVEIKVGVVNPVCFGLAFRRHLFFIYIIFFYAFTYKKKVGVVNAFRSLSLGIRGWRPSNSIMDFSSLKSAKARGLEAPFS